MIDTLITSKTRIKLLLKFFLNPDVRGHLRGLADEFGESTNAVRTELNRLAEAGLLLVADEGRRKLYGANSAHPLFPEIRSIVAKTMGMDQVVEHVVRRLGNVELAFVTGDYARGRDSGLIDLVLVGDVETTYLQDLVARVETLTERKLRPLVLSRGELERLQEKFVVEGALVIWSDGHAGDPSFTDLTQEVREA